MIYASMPSDNIIKINAAIEHPCSKSGSISKMMREIHQYLIHNTDDDTHFVLCIKIAKERMSFSGTIDQLFTKSGVFRSRIRCKMIGAIVDVWYDGYVLAGVEFEFKIIESRNSIVSKSLSAGKIVTTVSHDCLFAAFEAKAMKHASNINPEIEKWIGVQEAVTVVKNDNEIFVSIIKKTPYYKEVIWDIGVAFRSVIPVIRNSINEIVNSITGDTYEFSERESEFAYMLVLCKK